MRNQRSVINTLLFAAILLFIGQAHAQEPDWSLWAELLQESVSPGRIDGVELNRVDYNLLRQDERFNKLVEQISTYPVSKLETKEEKLAFYINLYNIYAIKMVVDHWPVESIKDAGSLFTSVWKKPVGKLASQTISLHEIEHKILRRMGEARIHMAIVCASVSCPDLRTEPFTAVRLNEQLDEQSRLFLVNNMKGLRVDEDEIVVSKIFDWFEEDFAHYGGVKGFIKKYTDSLPDKEIDADLPYNWNLNNRN